MRVNAETLNGIIRYCKDDQDDLDMVTKAIRARLPVLISKAVATDKTVLIARQYGLTLICSATSKHIDVLSE